MADTSKVKENLYTSLKELGLTESEINLYTISLTLGPSPLAKIAEHLNVPRPNVYKVIAGLERHGLAAFSGRKQYSRTFVVEPPTAVLEKLRKQKETITALDNALVSNMPELLTLYHQGASPTKIRILEGKEQFLKLFYQSLDEANKTIEWFGSEKEWVQFISWENERAWIKKRVRRGIAIKLLLLPSSETEELAGNAEKELREVRVLQNTPPFVTSFQLFGDKMVLWQPKAPLAVVIEDEFLVQMFRSVFYTLWTAAK